MSTATASPPQVEAKLWIDGAWLDGAGGNVQDVESPATGDRLGTFALAGIADVARAVEAAERASGEWAARTVFDRAAALQRVAERLDSRREELALLLSYEQGKPWRTEALPEVEGAIACFEIAADAVRNLEGSMLPSADSNKRILVYRVPLGVVAAIQPWNYPLTIAAGQVAPALGSGNAVVMLPAPTTSLVAHEFARCIAAADIPAGVFNFVTGPGADIGDALTGDERVQAVAFTGSSATGARVAKSAAGKALVMELGGNGPTVVLEDADLDKAVSEAVGSVVVNAGQACTAGERFLVHTDVYDEFAERLLAAMRDTVRLGHPLGDDTTMGPLHNEPTAAKMDRHVADAVEQGAAPLLGGKRAPGFPTALYWPVTILGDVTEAMAVASEETFGPIAPLQRIRSEEEAMRALRASPYGLASAVFTRDLARAIRFAELAPTGTVTINTNSTWAERHVPFGGRAGKQSGSGRDSGRYSIEGAYTELKTVYLDLT